MPPQRRRSEHARHAKRALTLGVHPERPMDVMGDPEGMGTIPGALLEPLTVDGKLICCLCKENSLNVNRNQTVCKPCKNSKALFSERLKGGSHTIPATAVLTHQAVMYLSETVGHMVSWIRELQEHVRR